MNLKSPGAIPLLFAALVVGMLLGQWAAGPMPEIKREAPEPERNYTLETLRTLNQPKVEYYRGPEPQRNDPNVWMLSSSMYYPNGDRELARVR